MDRCQLGGGFSREGSSKRTAILVAFLLLQISAATALAKDHKPFAATVKQLSEEAGFFDSDNLISNETSYQHVIGKMREMDVRGGVYLGVGPDQNFTYIARVRPKMAIIIDIRHENQLQHLMFKTLFARARNRIEYLCLLFGRPFPKDHGWEARGVKDLIDYIDNTPADARLFEKTVRDVRREVRRYEIPLADADLASIERIQRAFFSSGLELRYSSLNRPPRSIYPTYRDLLLEKDLSGQMQNYLNSEDDFRFLKKLQEDDMVIPVVGDLSGSQAMRAVAAYVTGLKEHVSAFYVSNVEFYLERQGSFEKYIENLRALPLNAKSVIIRSYFNYYAPPHPQTVSGHFSTQLMQRFEDLFKQCEEGDCQSYNDVVTKNSISLW